MFPVVCPQIDSLRQQLYGMEQDQVSLMAANQELQAHLELGGVGRADDRGPQLEAMQRELAALEAMNQRLQMELERAKGGGYGGSPLQRSSGVGADELRRKDADLTRSNTLVDIKTQECNRLRSELDVAHCKREEAADLAAQATNALRESMARVQAMEMAYSGAPPDPNGALQKVWYLEREKAEMEEAMRELVTETNGKAKTIADLLSLQDEMVNELDAMRKDLARVGQEEGGGYDRGTLDAVVRQKEMLEAEKQELEDALYRYQQSGADGISGGDGEGMRRAEMFQMQLNVADQEKAQLEDALRRFENVNQQIEMLQVGRCPSPRDAVETRVGTLSEPALLPTLAPEILFFILRHCPHMLSRHADCAFGGGVERFRLRTGSWRRPLRGTGTTPAGRVASLPTGAWTMS